MCVNMIKTGMSFTSSRALEVRSVAVKPPRSWPPNSISHVIASVSDNHGCRKTRPLNLKESLQLGRFLGDTLTSLPDGRRGRKITPVTQENNKSWHGRELLNSGQAHLEPLPDVLKAGANVTATLAGRS